MDGSMPMWNAGDYTDGMAAQSLELAGLKQNFLLSNIFIFICTMHDASRNVGELGQMRLRQQKHVSRSKDAYFSCGFRIQRTSNPFVGLWLVLVQSRLLRSWVYVEHCVQLCDDHVCVITGNNPTTVCKRCSGQPDTFCSCNDPYAGYEGAFFCMASGVGDVTFVRHSTVAEFIANGNSAFVEDVSYCSIFCDDLPYYLLIYLGNAHIRKLWELAVALSVPQSSDVLDVNQYYFFSIFWNMPMGSDRDRSDGV